MKRPFLLALACLMLLMTSCANHIRYADAVIWDRVPGSDKVSLDEERIDGGLVRAKVRFVCQKRQYAVTNEYLTPYVAQEELYEVPVGLVTLPFSFLWWIICQGISFASAPVESAAAPLHWSTAGLNPLLNVENGMFAERYVIEEKEGSRRPQEGSTPDPYDAVLPPVGGAVKACFEGGGTVEVFVGDELLLTVNLIELARVIPEQRSQKILIDVALKWNPETDPVVKTVSVFIDKDLAAKLFSLKSASQTLMTTRDQAAFDKALKEVDDAGFSREGAMIKDRRKGELLAPAPTPVK